MSLFGKKKEETKAEKSCHQLYDNTLKAVEGMGIEVEYITDLQKIMEYGAMSMPALVINEKVVSVGRVLKPAEITAMISDIQDKPEANDE